MECDFCSRAVGVELRDGKPPLNVPGWLIWTSTPRPLMPGQNPHGVCAKFLCRPYNALCPECRERVFGA